METKMYTNGKKNPPSQIPFTNPSSVTKNIGAPSKSDGPRILSNRMLHRHPSFSKERYHNPSLSEQHPFPWLEESKMYKQLFRHRSESVFASSERDFAQMIERHLLNKSSANSYYNSTGVTDDLEDATTVCEDPTTDDVFSVDTTDQSSKIIIPKLKKKRKQPKQKRQPSYLQETIQNLKNKRKVSFEIKRELFSVSCSLAGEKIEKRIKKMTGSNKISLVDAEYRQKLIEIIDEMREEEMRKHEKQLEENEKHRTRLLDADDNEFQESFLSKQKNKKNKRKEKQLDLPTIVVSNNKEYGVSASSSKKINNETMRHESSKRYQGKYRKVSFGAGFKRLHRTSLSQVIEDNNEDQGENRSADKVKLSPFSDLSLRSLLNSNKHDVIKSANPLSMLNQNVSDFSVKDLYDMATQLVYIPDKPVKMKGKAIKCNYNS